MCILDFGGEKRSRQIYTCTPARRVMNVPAVVLINILVLNPSAVALMALYELFERSGLVYGSRGRCGLSSFFRLELKYEKKMTE